MSLIIKMDTIKTEEHLRKSIPYIMNEKKTDGLCFSNAGITPGQILDTFFLTKQMHPTHGTRQGYHFKFSFSKDEFTRVLHDGRSDVFAVEKTSPLSILIYLYILIFCAGVVAGVVAVPIAPRRYIRPIFRTIPAPNIVAPYLWIKYSIAECTRIKCVAVCLH